MVALNFDDTAFGRAAAAAVPLQGLGDVLEFGWMKAGHETYRTRATPFPHDPNDAVGGKRLPPWFAAATVRIRVTGHARAFGRRAALNCPTACAMNRRICIFCGSSPGTDVASYRQMARETSQAIVRAGFGIVYGGGRVGLMGVVADAALEAGGEVVGVIPRALARAEIAHDGLTRLHVVGSMHERKRLMAEASVAFIALPGGFGTMDEFCEILSWRQLGIHDKPIGLLDYRGYFDRLLALFDAMVAEGFVGAANRRLFVDAPDIHQLLAAMFPESRTTPV